jgi:hypothetical protein
MRWVLWCIQRRRHCIFPPILQMCKYLYAASLFGLYINFNSSIAIHASFAHFLQNSVSGMALIVFIALLL